VARQEQPGQLARGGRERLQAGGVDPEERAGGAAFRPRANGDVGLSRPAGPPSAPGWRWISGSETEGLVVHGRAARCSRPSWPPPTAASPGATSRLVIMTELTDSSPPAGARRRSFASGRPRSETPVSSGSGMANRPRPALPDPPPASQVASRLRVPLEMQGECLLSIPVRPPRDMALNAWGAWPTLPLRNVRGAAAAPIMGDRAQLHC
jgi:hypothetical protein